MRRSITALFLFFTSMSSWAQATVGFDLSGGSTFTTGSTVNLILMGTNFSTGSEGVGANGLEAGGVDLSFNSAVLNLESVSFSSTFDLTAGNGLQPVVINNSGPGSSVTGVDFFAFVNTPPTGTFEIATFSFLAEGPGSTALSLTGDPLFAPFLDGNSNQINQYADYNLLNANVSVSSLVAPTPEPPTLWLLAGAALIGLCVSRRMATRSGARIA